MALFAEPTNREKPQQNQYLTANPSTQPNANTSWMSPSDSNGGSGSGGFTGGNIAQSQPNPPSQVSNGTALGSVAQGNNPWGLPGNSIPFINNQQSQPMNQVGHDGVFNGMNREQWRDQWMGSGRMTPEQMQQKLTSMGATPSARGDIWTTPFGETYDLGIGYKTGNPTAGWTPVQGGGGGMLGGGQVGQQFTGGMDMNQLLQMLTGGRGGFNPGATPINAMQQQAQPSQSNYFGNTNTNSGHNPSIIEQYLGGGGNNFGISFLGGGVIDPVTGIRRNPRPGEPQ